MVPFFAVNGKGSREMGWGMWIPFDHAQAHECIREDEDRDEDDDMEGGGRKGRNRMRPSSGNN